MTGEAQTPIQIEITAKTAALPVVADVLPKLREVLIQQGYQVGSRDLNTQSAGVLRLLLRPDASQEKNAADLPETFNWVPSTTSGKPAGGTLSAPTQLSLEAGILWLTDRVAVTGKVPDQNHHVVRAFTRSVIYLSMPTLTPESDSQQQLAAALANFRHEALTAARLGATDVVMYGFNRVFIWDDTTRPTAEVYRAFYRQAAGIAHQFGLRLFLYGDEFIYQPAWLKAQGARLSTSDPRLWQALASKYRQVLTALPQIDGIMTRTGEVIPWPGVKAFDLIHDRGDHGNRDIVDNYREFLQTLYGVIVGEFGKTYIHRTWATNNYEQSSVPEIYKEIFNSELPTKNFLSAIKLTLTDQWEYQPLNPTFGVTPHATLASVEIDRCTSPITDYALPFVQSGMEYAHEHGAVGLLNGVGPGLLNLDVGDTAINESLAYSLWRLSWTPKANLQLILQDWAKRRLGAATAPQVAKILPSLGDIVRDTWYLRPVADTNWNPQQLFGGARFEMKGTPIWDRGSGQDRFLRDIYLTIKPWMRETMAEVAEGTPRYDRILEEWSRIQPQLTDPAVGKAWEQRIRRARDAQHIYSDYVQTFLICYQYRDTPTTALHDELASRLSNLKNTLAEYRTKPNHFQTQAIEVFIDIADRTLANREALEQYLADAPTPKQIDQHLRADEAHDQAMAQQCRQAQTFLSWNGAVDGRDVLTLRAGKLTYDTRVGNDPHNIQMKIHQPIPKHPLTYFLDRHAGRGWTILLQAPSAANDWTAKIYIDDPQPSEDVYRFDLKGAENCTVPTR